MLFNTVCPIWLPAHVQFADIQCLKLWRHVHHMGENVMFAKCLFRTNKDSSLERLLFSKRNSGKPNVFWNFRKGCHVVSGLAALFDIIYSESCHLKKWCHVVERIYSFKSEAWPLIPSCQQFYLHQGWLVILEHTLCCQKCLAIMFWNKHVNSGVAAISQHFLLAVFLNKCCNALWTSILSWECQPNMLSAVWPL